MRAWPQTLLVEHDLDAVCVTLGPSQRITAWGGLAGILCALLSAGGLAANGQMFLGGLVSVLGITAGGAVRMRGWVREEAPLELWVRVHGLELRRVYRKRLLHTETVPYDVLEGCSASSNGLVLTYRGGRVRRLVTGFRSRAELDWVGEFVQDRLTASNAGRADPRIERLLEAPRFVGVRPDGNPAV